MVYAICMCVLPAANNERGTADLSLFMHSLRSDPPAMSHNKLIGRYLPLQYTVTLAMQKSTHADGITRLPFAQAYTV